MIVTDMLSIIYTQEEKEKKKMIQNSRDKQVEGKVMKHVKEKDSKMSWTFDNGREKEIQLEKGGGGCGAN